ncbi:hypothetical protein BKA93DRAFT_91797 [Sparassis latifolia]|uniref:Glutamyl-tRNA(Gln) amidotransferase subunit F, mitochondrial n=1 Tax=Sparassis crispa TaxID=139825 RepID=A0A401GB28_9APHY|nr:hypothetical protein SCP_0205550 [Sparassis crispa]GBE79357.1 hypothetical protein SCP_0205550 [Sparassis crispa]
MSCAARRRCTALQHSCRRLYSSGVAKPSRTSRKTLTETDSCGIPLQPTWSVNELLSSYPQPVITPSTLQRLHALSALIPPAEGTPEHETLTREMEEMVRLVEAVRLVDTSEVAGKEGDIPDGRIWAEGVGIDISEAAQIPVHDGEINGRQLLQHSSRVSNALYEVNSQRTK